MASNNHHYPNSNSSNNSGSKPRPIHSSHRPIRETPHETEPSYSYEERVIYMMDEELPPQIDDVEDAFHRRLASSGGGGGGGGNFNNSRRDTSNSGGGGSNNANVTNKRGGGGGGGGNDHDPSIVKLKGGDGGSGSSIPNYAGSATSGGGGAGERGNNNTTGGGGGGGSSSFWRTSSAMMMQQAPVLNLGGPPAGCTNRRNRSGGLLASAMQSTDGVVGGPPTTNVGPLPKGFSTGGGQRTIQLPVIPIKEIAVRERKQSGGLLGAALQLHETTTTTTTSADVPSGGNIRKFDSSRYRRQGSSGNTSSSNHQNSKSKNEETTNTNNPKSKQRQKEIAKARDTARKYKLEAQHSGTIEYGHLDDEKEDQPQPNVVVGPPPPDYLVPLQSSDNQRRQTSGSAVTTTDGASSIASSTTAGDNTSGDVSSMYGPLPTYKRSSSTGDRILHPHQSHYRRSGSSGDGFNTNNTMDNSSERSRDVDRSERSRSGGGGGSGSGGGAGGDHGNNNHDEAAGGGKRSSSSLIFPAGVLPTTTSPSSGGGPNDVPSSSFSNNSYRSVGRPITKLKHNTTTNSNESSSSKANHNSNNYRSTSVGTVGSSVGSSSSSSKNNNHQHGTGAGSGGMSLMSNPLTAGVNSVAKSVATAPSALFNAVIPSQLNRERHRDELVDNTSSTSSRQQPKPSITISKDGSLSTSGIVTGGSSGGGDNGSIGTSTAASTTAGGGTTGTTTTSGSGNRNAALASSSHATAASSSTAKDVNKDSKRYKINVLLDQCETVRFPFKKKLMLNNLGLQASDIPVNDLYRTSLGNSLHKLSLAGNRLNSIPPKLVTGLPVLKTLDLSQCELHTLPERWNLPQLKRLNLSHNRLVDFPEETMLEGLPELHELNMYGNKVSVIVVPHNPKVLAKLETLNLGYNDLAYIPEELDRLKALRVLKVMNNFLEKIPMRVCDMDLKSIDVSSNPVIQPPIETCERGIGSMKRYYHCLKMEEQNKQRALEALQNSRRSKSTGTTSKSSSSGGGGFMGKKKGGAGSVMDKVLGFTKRSSSTAATSSTTPTKQSTRKSSDESRGSKDGTGARSVSLNIPSGKTSVVGFSGGKDTATKQARKSTPLPAAVMSADPTSSLKRSISTPTPTVPGDDDMMRPPTVGPTKASSSIEPGVKIGPVTGGASDDHRNLSTASAPAAAPAAAPSTITGSDGGDADISETTSRISEYNRIMKEDVTVNDTLKVIFVGMAMAGKTSMIKRLIEGTDAVIPKRDERTVGVDIYNWDTKKDNRFKHIDCRIDLQDKELDELCGDVNAKFSVWDFAGQHVYHATHELFFSPRALYVLVWDMGATNPATKQRKSAEYETTQGAFKLSYDSDEDSSDDDDFTSEEEARRADRALERDIDDKVQFWVDCIQTSAPGAAILPVATFDDMFSDNDNQEAIRRCKMLKQRLLKHEARRLQGIKDRLKEYIDSNRANDENAMRLRKLLSTYTRPKLIFGDTDRNAVVRVSGTRYTGFGTLTERIINIATGRDTLGYRYPIFRGHLGARIPRMRLEVREAVRRMRDKFKVVEWGYFINLLREDYGGTMSVEDISDALLFLTNIGELSYFGGQVTDREAIMNSFGAESSSFVRRDSSKIVSSGGDDYSAVSEDDDDDDDDDDDENGFYSTGNTSLTVPITDDGSLSTLGDNSGGLSQFVFLNPRWLVAAVACILRHDLDREIQETRRLMEEGNNQLSRGDSFYEVNLNCPVITAEDACMLWQAKKFTKKAAERAEQYSNHVALKPFEFLQLLLIKFGVFVPIDLGTEKVCLGGFEYSRDNAGNGSAPTEEITLGQDEIPPPDSTFFFLPSLLGPGEPVEAWTYKSTDSWKATLCHSVLFPDGVAPGLMERITATVLSNIYSIAHQKETPLLKSMLDGKLVPAHEGHLTVKEVLCWRTAFLVKLGMQMGTGDDLKESVVEVFCGLVDKDSHLCVGSEYMSSGQRRLITSGKGQEGDGGRKIWVGGYRLVISAVQKVMAEYGGLEYEKQAFCPTCLAKRSAGEASSWAFSVIRAAAKNGQTTITCRHGHRVDTRLVAGPSAGLQPQPKDNLMTNPSAPEIPITDLLRGVVVVGLWDGNTKKVVRVGSGFIADKKRGLIVTASHTLMNIWGDPSAPFGDNYYGLRQGKVCIGVIPRNKGGETGTEAYFRYFAKIVRKDPDIDQGVCHLDACVLRITTRMENDVGGNGEGCGDQIEQLLLNNPHALKQEKLQQLKITDRCELDEQVRIVGYNQGGEGLLGPGVSLNRRVDMARGYVCKKFGGGEVPPSAGDHPEIRHRFKPREEIVVICPTIGGHSGGPCVNQQGEVIGILSRADPAERQRCYLVPTYEWTNLLREAKHIL